MTDGRPRGQPDTAWHVLLRKVRRAYDADPPLIVLVRRGKGRYDVFDGKALRRILLDSEGGPQEAA